MNLPRIVITGAGLTSPCGDDLGALRAALLAGHSGVSELDVRHMGRLPAGVCRFDEFRHQSKKSRRRGTRAGSIAIWCAQEALAHAGLALEGLRRDRVGVYAGITEHGNVETEAELQSLAGYQNDVRFWSHHHNPRTIANNPAGEATLALGITGPHYTIGAACAAGNAGVIQGAQMLALGEVDVALAGGVSESIHSFGIFAAFRSQNALATHPDPTKASRPFDRARNGIVVSEGGCLFVLERLEDALARGARILGEVAGHAMNSDATDFVMGNPETQARCMRLALDRAGLGPGDVDLVSTHATATPAGDAQECKALLAVFGERARARFNNAKSMLGHCMGAAGALELAGNLPSFDDALVHPTINLDDPDPECRLPNLVAGRPERAGRVDVILNNSFGMLGINSVLVVKAYRGGQGKA